MYEEGEELFNDASTESIPTDKLRTPVSHDGRPSPATESPGTDAIADENIVSTTEGDNGLTAAMMDKAAFDLYAIFQQAQDENASNYVDENATNSSLEDDDDRNTTEEVTNDFLVCKLWNKVTKCHTLIQYFCNNFLFVQINKTRFPQFKKLGLRKLTSWMLTLTISLITKLLLPNFITFI